MIPREVILKKASELITGDRDKEYGDAFTNFNDIAQGWSLILKKHVTREDVALCMAWVKMARLAKNPTHQDSWVDIAGYGGRKGPKYLDSIEERFARLGAQYMKSEGIHDKSRHNAINETDFRKGMSYLLNRENQGPLAP